MTQIIGGGVQPTQIKCKQCGSPYFSQCVKIYMASRLLTESGKDEYQLDPTFQCTSCHTEFNPIENSEAIQDEPKTSPEPETPKDDNIVKLFS